jgi:hypothetical protein
MRGPQLEALVKRLFLRAHFRVERNAGAAAPRQTDLAATNGADNYLIETKWQRTPADVGDVDNVRIRLLETHSSMIGLLISVSGFSNTAITRVEARRDRPVLLMTGNELAEVLAHPGDLAKLLRDKREELMLHGRVLTEQSPRRVSTLPDKSPGGGLPASAASFLVAGERQQVLTCGGEYGQFVFAQEMPDVDWVPGGGVGVGVSLSLPAGDQNELLSCFAELGDGGWLTSGGRWNIQQAATNWHGIGPASLATAITGWADRYRHLDAIHHTEQFCYQDVCEGGFFTLTVDIAAAEYRRVWHCELSFELSGIPLDLTPLQQLAARLRVDHPVYFRPREGRSVERRSLQKDNLRVEPVGFIVLDDDDDPRTREWVCGIVVANPFALSRHESSTNLPKWLPGYVDGCELLTCGLRQWHPLDHPVTGYRLENCEWAWTSDALVFHTTANWTD